MNIFESIAHWWNELIQKFYLNSLLSQFHWIDVGVILFLFVGIIYGLKKGFWKVFFDLIRIVVVIALSLEFEPWIVAYFQTPLGFIPETFRPIFFLGVTGLLFWFLVTVLIRGLRALFVTKTSWFVQVFGGIVLGSLYAFLTASFFAQIVMRSPWTHIKDLLSGSDSHSGPYLVAAAPEIHARIVPPVKVGVEKTVLFVSDLLRHSAKS